MVQSIVSTFFGVCFPHTVICDEDTDQVFIHLYEASSAVKVITTISLLEKCIQDFFPGTEIEAFLGRKEPLMIVVNGEMEQQPLGISFLGTIFEEKFHVKCLSLFILPCVPLIPEHMRRMVHPDISPNQFEEGIKNGYYMVNLSVNQTFGPPEFHGTEVDEDPEIPEDVNMHHNENFLHSDNDDIESHSENLQTDNDENENAEEERFRSADLSSVDDEAVSENLSSRDNGMFENLSSYGNGMFENLSSNDDGMSETSQFNNYSPRSPYNSSQEQEQNRTSPMASSRRPKVFVAASESSESSQSSKSLSINSSDESVIRALKKTHLRNSSHYSSSSQSSIGSSNSKPFFFGSSNNSQQNLDLYIRNKRSKIPSSTFFDKVGNNVKISRSNEQSSVSEVNVTEHHGLENNVRSAALESHQHTLDKHFSSLKNQGKRKRLISPDIDSEEDESLRCSKQDTSEASSVTGTSLHEEVVSINSQPNDNANDSERATSDSDYSSKRRRSTKGKGKGKAKVDSKEPKKRSKRKSKEGSEKKDKTNINYGSMEQTVLKF